MKTGVAEDGGIPGVDVEPTEFASHTVYEGTRQPLEGGE